MLHESIEQACEFVNTEFIDSAIKYLNSNEGIAKRMFELINRSESINKFIPFLS